MSRIFAALQYFETQAKISNDRLASLCNQQDALLKEKESHALLIDKLSQMKGTGPTGPEVDAAIKFAKDNGIDISDLKGRLTFFHAGSDPQARAYMYVPTNENDKKNLDGFAEVIKRVEQQMNRVGDRITQMNTQTQRYLTEAHDGEARVSALLADYKGLLQEMRK